MEVHEGPTRRPCHHALRNIVTTVSVSKIFGRETLVITSRAMRVLGGNSERHLWTGVIYITPPHILGLEPGNGRISSSISADANLSGWSRVTRARRAV